MAHYDLHTLLIRKTKSRILAKQIESARRDGRDDDFVDLLATKRKLDKQIREMMAA